MRRLVLGAASAAVYLAAAAFSWEAGLVPGRVLYDGLAPPQPYRYVNAPPDAQTTDPALGGSGAVEFGPEQSLGNSISTDDGQATVVFRLGSIAPREGQTFVDVTIEPLDPATLPPGPGDLTISGNAYRVRAVYRESGEPAVVDSPIAIVMRYPIHATVLLAQSDTGWEPLESTPSPASLQLFGDAARFTTFVAAAEGPSPGLPWWVFVGSGGALVAVVAAILLRRGSSAPASRSERRRASRQRGRGRGARGARGRSSRGGRGGGSRGSRGRGGGSPGRRGRR